MSDLNINTQDVLELGDSFLTLAEELGVIKELDIDTVFNSLKESICSNLGPAGEIADKILTKFLEPIKAWMDENKPMVEAATKVVKGFMLAWEATKLMAFIQQSGGLVVVVNKAVTALKDLTYAKVLDNAETVKKTALDAKAFLKDLPQATVALAKQAKEFAISTAVKAKDAIAQVAMNIATGQWSIVSTIATAATTAFGAAVAFLTSPIGLVILAITAIIAIGFLLYKHWDEVSAFAIQVWGVIKDAFAQFGDWLWNVFSAIWTNVFSIFTNILNGFFAIVSYVWSIILGAFSQFGDWISTVFTTIWTDVFNFFSNILNGFFATVSYVWGIIQGTFTQFNDWLTGIFATNWTDQFGVFGNILNGFFATVSDIWEAIKRIFGGVIDFVAGVFTGDWSRAWQGIKDIFGGIMDGLGAVIKAPLNGIISLINAAIDGLNSISIDIPNWDILPDSIQGKALSFNIPRINYLYTGGVFDKPTLIGNTVVGDKYKGSGSQREWVLPDQLLRKTMKEVVGQEIAMLFNRLAYAVGSEIAATTTNVVANNSMVTKDNAINDTLMNGGSKVIENHIHVDIEGREVAKAVAPYQGVFDAYQIGR